MKPRISDSNDLDARIRELEALQVQQTEEIRMSFRELADSLSPANMIKNVMSTVISSPGLRSTVLDSAISAGAGILGKKLVVRNSHNMIRKMTGTAVQFLLSNFVRNKMPAIKENMAAKTNGVEH
ncbi:MAG: hypothetical protein H7Y01_05840 [Ferruginibacter sp.]|nr:hypothetical protein [Chitinophagaceae bacterium]